MNELKQASITRQKAAALALYSFEYEINLSRFLRHPNLVRCFGATVDDHGDFWAVFELCAGGTLQGMLQTSGSTAHVSTPGLKYSYDIIYDDPPVSDQQYADEPTDQPAVATLAWGKRFQIAIDVAHGLKNLHDNGVCHRDIKSENILLDARGRALIADLGCAQSDKLVQEEESAVVASGSVFFCDVRCIV